ncbi:MAG: 3-dehydroquinate synthase family protein [Acidobacteriota bacterium]
MNAAISPQRILVGDGDGTIWVGAGLVARARDHLVSPSGRYLLVTSSAAQPCAEGIRASLGEPTLLDLEIADGEPSKTLAAVATIAEAALAAGLRRDDAFIAVGGGVVTDVVGFAAAILLRGIAWNAVPTTTAGMADAAIGGKTAVNHPRGKNLLGAFHPPRAILIDPLCLATLPDRDYRAGLVEAFKAAWIADGPLARRAAAALPAILSRDAPELLELLAGSVRVKAGLVTADPLDAGPRRLLNFGHTLGHALEVAGGYGALRHGEAVAWGIAAALEISRRRAGLSETDAAAVREILSGLGPFPEPERSAARLSPLLERDKKATARGTAGVLLEAIGRARVEASVSSQEWLEAAAIITLS